MAAAVGAGGVLPSGQYFGRILGRGGAGGFSTTETFYRPGEDLPPHAHERAFFCLTLSGAYTERTSRFGETLYAPYSAVFHPAGEVHVTRMTPAGGRILNVEIDPRFVGLAGKGAGSPARDLHGGELVWLLARLQRAARAADPDEEGELESLGFDLLGAVEKTSRPSRVPPAWLHGVVERLREDPGPRPSVLALAAEAGVHPVHLARVFRHHRGETIASFVRRLRVQRAARLLSRKGQGLACVAALAGFADQSHMTRAFRRVALTTPSVFRGAGS